MPPPYERGTLSCRSIRVESLEIQHLSDEDINVETEGPGFLSCFEMVQQTAGMVFWWEPSSDEGGGDAYDRGVIYAAESKRQRDGQ